MNFFDRFKKKTGGIVKREEVVQRKLDPAIEAIIHNLINKLDDWRIVEHDSDTGRTYPLKWLKNRKNKLEISLNHKYIGDIDIKMASGESLRLGYTTELALFNTVNDRFELIRQRNYNKERDIRIKRDEKIKTKILKLLEK